MSAAVWTWYPWFVSTSWIALRFRFQSFAFHSRKFLGPSSSPVFYYLFHSRILWFVFLQVSISEIDFNHKKWSSPPWTRMQTGISRSCCARFDDVYTALLFVSNRPLSSLKPPLSIDSCRFFITLSVYRTFDDLHFRWNLKSSFIFNEIKTLLVIHWILDHRRGWN